VFDLWFRLGPGSDTHIDAHSGQPQLPAGTASGARQQGADGGLLSYALPEEVNSMESKLRKLVKGEPMRTVTGEEMEEMGSTWVGGFLVRSWQQGLEPGSVEKDMHQRVRKKVRPLTTER